MDKIIAHLDMDAFFASIEQRDNPQIRDRPVVIGSDPKKGRGRGVVSTCSYQARKIGIHSAMPISKAYQLCPQAIFLPVRMNYYLEITQQIFQILTNFSPIVQPISIDEAFLDLSGTFNLHGLPLSTGQKLKNQIKKQLNLTASIGIAPNMTVAKIASAYCKPNGLLEIKTHEVLDFLWPLPINKLWGVGSKTNTLLNSYKIFTIGHLAQMKVENLIKLLGKNGLDLFNLANGRDERELAPIQKTKSLGHEYTFDQDTNNHEIINQTLLKLSERISHRLRTNHLKGLTISLKIRFSNFQTHTKSITLKQPTNFTDNIFFNLKDLLAKIVVKNEKIRLLGVNVSNFKKKNTQASLFNNTDNDTKKNEKIENLYQAVDKIKKKFGEKAIHRIG